MLWIRELGLLLLCGAILATTAASGMAQEADEPPQASAEAGMRLLEQMESAVVATVRNVGPSVVTIEGKVPLPKLKIRRLPRPGGLKRTGRAGRQNGTDAERTAQEATQAAEKTLEEVRKRIQILGGVPVTGSGFLLHGGMVVTTAEVIRSVREPVVVLSDGTRVAADWVNPDPEANIAVLHVSGIDPQLGLQWGDSNHVFRGSFVLTIGNQAGFPNSFSLGSVAGTGRAGRSGALRYNDLIQFQAAVGAGGSGGPLLNIRGEVVGMIVATPANAVGLRLAPPAIPDAMDMGRRSDATPGSQPAVAYRLARIFLTGQETQDEDTDEDMAPQPDQSKSRHPQGDDEDTPYVPMPPMPPGPLFGVVANTGFALPSNDIRATIELLSKRASPAFRLGWIGANLSTDGPSVPGALVTRVYIGSPADKAGLKPGDVIVSINGQAVSKGNTLRLMVSRLNAGDTLKVEIVRGTTRHTLDLQIEARPDEDVIHKMPVRKLTPKTTLNDSLLCFAQQTV